MVKKYFLCISMLLAAQWSLGQNVKQLFTEFSSAPNVECVNLGDLGASLMKSFMGSKDIPGLSKVDALQVIDLSNCSAETKNKFAEKVKSLKDEEYETLVRSNENGENVRVLVKMNKEEIGELVVITTGNETSLVKIKGCFKRSDISKLTGNQ